MDESQSLEVLADALNALSEQPYDVSLHSKYVKLAHSLKGVESEVLAGLEMITQFMAVGDEIWLALIDAKEVAVDLTTVEGVEELIALFVRAEADYLSIPILEKHLQFLLQQYALYASEGQIKADELGDLFSARWTRKSIDDVVRKGLSHMTQSYKLWDAQRDWELEMLEGCSASEKPSLVSYMKNLLLERLHQPHSNLESTFQSYSSFTTNFMPPQDYETLLVAASKIRSQSSKSYDRREHLETALTSSGYALEAYNHYIGYERRARYPDLSCTRGVYERAIGEAAGRRFANVPGSEEALRVFWAGYCDALRILEAGADIELEVARRAVRSVPASGEVWARYVRLLERIHTTAVELPNELETVADTYIRALDARLVQADIEEIVPLVLARAGFEKRQLEAGNEDEDALLNLIGILEGGIGLAHQSSKSIDPKLRLERFLAQIYENAGLIDNAFGVWISASKHSKSNYLVWINYTDALIKHQRFEEARNIFTEIHTKQLDWPEALWEAWIAFEHLHGSVEELEACLDKVEKARYQTNARRAREAEKASYQAMQTVVDVQASMPQAETSIPDASAVPQNDAAMNVDQPIPTDRGTKRAIDDEEASNVHKKARLEQKQPPLKRDRENATVFVADLAQDVTEDDLKTLFKDCGSVREVKITQLTDSVVATVEFFDRENVPAGLTKDKKRLHDQEISVHLAWKSTLYVTNFPESADDQYMRNLFGKYGTIFDLRWPSKKFKSSRRFCYVQFTSPDAAQRSLELHGRELEQGLPLTVYISNPERKKERTDQHANEREIYVAGLSRFTTKADLEKLFATYGSVKEVRIALEENGHARGFAFVEFEEANDAQSALMANNHELKKRRIAVTLSDPRVRARHKSDTILSRVAETRTRSVYIKNLPSGTQEGLLQQALEKITAVKRVEVFLEKQEAVVELENPADAGRLLLRSEPIVFHGNTLELSEDLPSSRLARTPANNSSVFKPRQLGPSKPKTGLGFKKASAKTRQDEPSTSAIPFGGGKDQDDFRKLLLQKK